MCDRITYMSKKVYNKDQVFGYWKIINPYPKINDKRAECLCKLCNKIYFVNRTHLKQGVSTKCFKCRLLELKQVPPSKTHGLSKTREYRIWKSMRMRILNPQGRDIENYKGIKLYSGWNSFETFLKDMGKIPSNNIRYSIGRIDNKGDYSPENCRWETDIQQANNTSRNNYITYKGERMSIADWARKLNINYYKLRGRLTNYGWSIEKSFNTK